MQLKQLRESIAYEAKIPDIDALGGWLDQTIIEVFDDYTAQIRYPELLVPAVVLTLSNTTGIVALPSDIQHLDTTSIRFRKAGDSTQDYVLTSRQSPWGDNIGRPKFTFADSTSTNLAQINIWPTAEVTTSDQLVINYWRSAIPASPSETLELIPRQLVYVVRAEIVARANTFADGKLATFYRNLARDKHSRSTGVTDVGTANG